MVLDPWKIVADTDMLEAFLENVSVVLNRSSVKDMNVENKVVSRGEARVYDVIYTELKPVQG
jgi:hypothetical protein